MAHYIHLMRLNNHPPPHPSKCTRVHRNVYSDYTAERCRWWRGGPDYCPCQLVRSTPNVYARDTIPSLRPYMPIYCYYANRRSDLRRVRSTVFEIHQLRGGGRKWKACLSLSALRVYPVGIAVTRNAFPAFVAHRRPVICPSRNRIDPRRSQTIVSVRRRRIIQHLADLRFNLYTHMIITTIRRRVPGKPNNDIYITIMLLPCARDSEGDPRVLCVHATATHCPRDVRTGSKSYRYCSDAWRTNVGHEA